MNNKQKNTPADRLIPQKDFVEKLGINRRTLYRLIDLGTIPRPVKQGRLNYFFESDLMKYFNGLKAQRS
ncbi:helix-turn-helix domain-containing protein [Verrucomicrobiaceae bacterium R5-34]|nr:helix-turn-helix domain-containing protein [Verrucomicrobiaceae bacterium R5-34]